MGKDACGTLAGSPDGGQEWHQNRKRRKGTPQGGVISPLLANLFLHYVLDKWLERNFGELRFVSTPMIVIHCRSEEEAQIIKLPEVEEGL